jgi:hypothetical protein
MQCLQKPALCRWVAQRVVLAASIGGALVACLEARAQAQEKVRGTVERLTTAPRGEIDGAVLDDGTVLHWPPHLEDQFKEIAAVGDRVEATGSAEIGKRGEVRFEVLRLKNLQSNASAGDDRGPKAPARGRPTDRDEQLRALQEQVRQLQRQIDRLIDER